MTKWKKKKKNTPFARFSLTADKFILHPPGSCRPPQTNYNKAGYGISLTRHQSSQAMPSFAVRLLRS